MDEVIFVFAGRESFDVSKSSNLSDSRGSNTALINQATQTKFWALAWPLVLKALKNTEQYLYFNDTFPKSPYCMPKKSFFVL